MGDTNGARGVLPGTGPDQLAPPPLAGRAGLADVTGVRGAGAFDAWLEQYEASIGRHLYRITGDRDLAADLAQETFLRLHCVLSRGGTIAAPRAWLYRVATNLALTALRRRARVGGLEPGMRAAGGMEEQVAQRDLVRRALAAIPPEQAACLVLTAIEGFRYAEAAEVLGISAEAVRKRVSRGEAAFRRAYERLAGRWQA